MNKLWNVLHTLSKQKIGKINTSSSLLDKELLIFEKLLKNNWKAISPRELADYIWENNQKIEPYLQSLEKKCWKKLVKKTKKGKYKIKEE